MNLAHLKQLARLSIVTLSLIMVTSSSPLLAFQDQQDDSGDVGGFRNPPQRGSWGGPGLSFYDDDDTYGDNIGKARWGTYDDYTDEPDYPDDARWETDEVYTGQADYPEGAVLLGRDNDIEGVSETPYEEHIEQRASAHIGGSAPAPVSLEDQQAEYAANTPLSDIPMAGELFQNDGTDDGRDLSVHVTPELVPGHEQED